MVDNQRSKPASLAKLSLRYQALCQMFGLAEGKLIVRAGSKAVLSQLFAPRGSETMCISFLRAMKFLPARWVRRTCLRLFGARLIVCQRCTV